VAPLRLGGLRGKKSTPSVWLGGTGGLFAVGKQEQEWQEPKGARGHQRSRASRPRYDCIDGMVVFMFDECFQL